MPVENLDFAAPFFAVRYVEGESAVPVEGRSIVLNLAEAALGVESQALSCLNSAVVQNCALRNVERAVIVDGFDAHADNDALFDRVRSVWPSAFDVRGEERLRGVQHYMSPKIWRGNIGLTMYHAGSVPLNVGLHKDHPFCPVPGFREVHTQIVGFGKMQQCRAQDVRTLYLEEQMAPGATHRPMYDAAGNYPWHQYETVTPGIFMAVEILPKGAAIPGQEAQND
ncbi:MAG: hypothetical protein AB3N22_15665 [Ruegeria sp.]